MLATTDRCVFAALFGIVIGLAVTTGPLSALKGRAVALSDDVVVGTEKALNSLLAKLPYGAQNPKVVAVLAVVGAVCAPGFVAIVLAVAANAAGAVKRAASGALLLASGAAFFVLPASHAMALMAVSAVASALVLAPGVFLARSVLWGFATVIASVHIGSLWAGTDVHIVKGTETLMALTEFSTVEFWKFCLIILGISPFVAAAGAALRGPSAV